MSEIHIEEHSSPIRTPKQLIIVVFLAFAVPITIIVMLIQLVTGSSGIDKDNPGMSGEAIAKRLKPVGEVVVDPNAPKTEASAPVALVAAPAPAPAVASDGDAARGKTVYDANCVVCHGAGVAGAPKAGDKTAWAPRIKTGMDALYASALKGKDAMPPKGGNLSLADADVKAAVEYLVSLAK